MQTHVPLCLFLFATMICPDAQADTLALDYALSSHGLHLADIETRTTLSPGGYTITAHSRTVGLVGFLARSDVTSTAAGLFQGLRVVPASYASSGHARGADRITRIVYSGGNPTVLQVTPPESDREPVPASQTHGSIDTLSVIVGLSRQVSATGHCDGTALVFDGQRLSRLEARTVGWERLPSGAAAAFSGPALRCDFVSRQLGGFLRDDTRARLMEPLHGSAWLAAPLKGGAIGAIRAVFESPLFGTATLALTRAGT